MTMPDNTPSSSALSPGPMHMHERTKETPPRISFGIIVLNGEPYTRYCLRQLYPFAHQIIVVEGASAMAAMISTADGHSTDGTLEALHAFKREEDLENKVTIITRDGFWSEKDEMSRAYAEQATGDYLWQVDIDEFFTHEDMGQIISLLHERPEVTQISFPQHIFWGDFDVVCGSVFIRGTDYPMHRLFKWGPGYQYKTHRPVTVLDPEGRDLREQHWLDAKELAKRRLFMYHYSDLFPRQVLEKSRYYSQQPWGSVAQKIIAWANENYMECRNLFRVHQLQDYPSWLEPFYGRHPEQIEAMRQDLAEGRIVEPRLNMERPRKAMKSWAYRLGRALLKLHADLIFPIAQGFHARRIRWRSLVGLRPKS